MVIAAQQTANLRRIARIIGLLIDQIADDDMNHSRRVAVMAWRLGQHLQLSASVLNDLLVAALIHDCGVKSSSEYIATVSHLRWRAENDHCVRGAEFIANCVILRKFHNIVRYHHTPWSKLERVEISDDEKIIANIIFCVDRCYVGFSDLVRNSGYRTIINHKADLIANVQFLGDTAIAPVVYAAFKEVAQKDGFWLSLYPEFLDSSLSPLNQNDGENIPVTLKQMQNLATMISRLVDAKSKFTQEHSWRVSVIAGQLAEQLGLQKDVITELEIAGLLHDVGKQNVPESALLKPGKLDDTERAIVKCHTIGTEMVLNSLFDDHRIVKWAANHHEKLDGSGYPNGLVSTELDTCSRILTVSDIFQALTQSRPYRESLCVEDALAIMDAMAVGGELDREIYGVLKSNGALFYDLSAQ